MTRVLIAFDKFKDALTARQACEAAANALRAKHPDWELDLCPLADGGEGFCETLTRAAYGEFEYVSCTGPRGNFVRAPIGYVGADSIKEALRESLKLKNGSRIAIIEMASASGLVLLPSNQRDPWQTSSGGTGELIAAATKGGAETILLGVGGSATNDLGFGALEALGFRFLDSGGVSVSNPVPAAWNRIVRIEAARALHSPRLLIACDVTNPLLGPAGAAATFGPQKGLHPDELPRLEEQAARVSALLCDACGHSHILREVPGTGAAGGFAFGLMVGAKAQLISGFTLVSDWLDLSARINRADLILTGEGRYDATSLAGKGPGALVEAAQRLRKVVHVFAGSVEPTLNLQNFPIHAISPPSMPLAQAIAQTEASLVSAIGSAFHAGPA